MGIEGADRQEAGRHPPPPSHLLQSLCPGCCNRRTVTFVARFRRHPRLRIVPRSRMPTPAWSQEQGGGPGRPAVLPFAGRERAPTGGQIRPTHWSAALDWHRTLLAGISSTSPRIDVNEVPHGAHVTRLKRHLGLCRRNGCCSTRSHPRTELLQSARGAPM